MATGNITAAAPIGKRTNSIECIPFSKEAFAARVRLASGSGVDVDQNQSSYLGRYLAQLGTKYLVVETHYIDRHFMEEASSYYSKCLASRPNYCQRIHAFREFKPNGLTKQALHAELVAAAADKTGVALRELKRRLQSSYCGFIVVRPLPTAPIGRTVLRHLEDDHARHFQVCTKCNVHFLGMPLTVHGLPFQQQDRGVAACATTAIWSALQKVCRRDADRAPTPTEVTLAGVRYLVPHGRSFPSTGLSFEQMCEALRRFEYAPFVFGPRGDSALFQYILYSYLRSGIPVILALHKQHETEGHAITVVGYRATGRHPIYSIPNGEKLHLINAKLSELYVHDDRIGPYASATLFEHTGNRGRTMRLSSRFPDGTPEQMEVWLAAAPLYGKLRTTPNDMLTAAGDLLPVIGEMVGAKPLGIETWFEMSGDYVQQLYVTGLDGKRTADFVERLSPSRYVGIVRWHLNGVPIVESVWDTTDTVRGGRFDQLLGLVALQERYVDDLALFGDRFSVLAC